VFTQDDLNRADELARQDLSRRGHKPSRREAA
jgi:hypothetical protein